MSIPSSRHASPFGATLLALGLSASQALHAQDATDNLHGHHSEHQHIAQASTGVGTLNAVTVEAKEIPQYLSNAPVSVSGPMGLTMRETPQSVSVITEERMRDEGLVSAGDVLGRTTGITFGHHSSQEGVHANARGFRMDNIMVDGLSLQGNQRKLAADLSLYEQVEVMRGPAGLYAGSGAAGNPGGAVNLVRKRPTRERRTNLQLSAGSWNNYRSTIDTSGALNASGSLRGRGIVSYIDREYFYDFGSHKNLTAGGSLEWDITSSTILTFGLDYETRDARIASPRRFTRWDGSDPGGPRSRSTGMPWGKSKWNEYGAFVQLEHLLANDWNFKTQYTYKKSDDFNDYASVSYYIDEADGKYRNFIQGSYGASKYWDQGFSADLTGKFDLWGRTHDFVTGFNFQSNKRHSLNIPSNWKGYGYGRRGAPSRLEHVDFDSMDYDKYPWLASSPDYSKWNIYEPDRQMGYYANVRFHLSEPLKVMTGFRVSRFSDGGISKYYLDTPEHKKGSYTQSNEVTPFAALSYDLNAQHTAHISYSEVFKIQDYYDIEGNRVDPLKGKNWELGVKSDWYGERLQTMLSLYRLERVNSVWRVEESPCQSLLAMHGITAACYVADNKQRTTGVEFEINGRITPAWDISVGLSAQRRKYVKRTLNGGAMSSGQGQSWNNTEPTRTANLWLMHRLQGAAQGWRMGLGVRAQNKTWSDYSGNITKDKNGNILSERSAFTIHQGGYTTFNAMISWQINPQWRTQLNIDNISSKNYQSQLSSWYVYNSAPRSYMLSLTGRF